LRIRRSRGRPEAEEKGAEEEKGEGEVKLKTAPKVLSEGGAGIGIAETPIDPPPKAKGEEE
jgi:hypothetical protein